MGLHHPVLNRLDQMTGAYFKRVPPSSYTPRFVTKRPEYEKKKWGECKVCPERVQAECRHRQMTDPAMPMMCELVDELDVLASGLDEKVLKILRTT